MLKTDSPRKMIRGVWKEIRHRDWVKNSYSDIAPSKARRNHGSVRIRGMFALGATAAQRPLAWRQASSALAHRDTRVHLRWCERDCPKI